MSGNEARGTWAWKSRRTRRGARGVVRGVDTVTISTLTHPRLGWTHCWQHLPPSPAVGTQAVSALRQGGCRPPYRASQLASAVCDWCRMGRQLEASQGGFLQKIQAQYLATFGGFPSQVGAWWVCWPRGPAFLRKTAGGRGCRVPASTCTSGTLRRRCLTGNIDV